jgi:recombinational DNA repair ATPase RecF
MYNVANRNTVKEPAEPSSNIRYISALTLFKQQYSAEIRERRDALQEGPSHRDSLIAYNKAVTELFQELRVERSDEFEALEATVEKMKLAQGQEFHEQSEEVQQALVILRVYPCHPPQ